MTRIICHQQKNDYGGFIFFNYSTESLTLILIQIIRKKIIFYDFYLVFSDPDTASSASVACVGVFAAPATSIEVGLAPPPAKILSTVT